MQYNERWWNKVTVAPCVSSQIALAGQNHLNLLNYVDIYPTIPVAGKAEKNRLFSTTRCHCSKF